MSHMYNSDMKTARLCMYMPIRTCTHALSSPVPNLERLPAVHTSSKVTQQGLQTRIYSAVFEMGLRVCTHTSKYGHATGVPVFQYTLALVVRSLPQKDHCPKKSHLHMHTHSPVTQFDCLYIYYGHFEVLSAHAHMQYSYTQACSVACTPTQPGTAAGLLRPSCTCTHAARSRNWPACTPHTRTQYGHA